MKQLDSFTLKILSNFFEPMQNLVEKMGARLAQKHLEHGDDWKTVPISSLIYGLQHSVKFDKYVDAANYCMMIEWRRKADGKKE